jgi:tripartite-type tricarboxylate transporter receptor subunit TctC
MDRRSFVIGTAATVAAGPAFAQEAYPARAITIINAFPPGGVNDLVTRPLATALEPILKQPVVVETKAGAGGQVGAQVGASAKPDGYTLLSHNTGISGYAEVDKLFDRPPKATRADFITLARLVADPVVLLVNDQQPYKSLKDFVDAAKQNPNTVLYSSGGLYGATHLPMALLATAAGGLELRHLPTNGGGPAITAILGNNVQATAQTVSASLTHIKSGKLRPLALYGGTRSKVLPEVPTLKELATTSNTICGSGCSRRKARHRRSSPRCAPPSTRPPTAISSRPRSAPSASIWPTSMGPTSGPSGTPTSSASARRCVRSAACRDSSVSRESSIGRATIRALTA